MKKIAAILAVMILCFCLAGCSGGGSGESVAPSGNAFIVITSPTGSSRHSTKDSTINLGGFVSDVKGLSQISWLNNQGGNGIATGTTEWSISNIPLQIGDNVITVTAENTYGETVNDSVTVTYNSNLDFLSNIQTNPDSIFINEPTEIIFRIGIENNPNLDKSRVKIVEIQTDNSTLELSVLADNGDVANSDDIASDGVFSGKSIITKNVEGIIKLRVLADTIESGESITAYSTVFDLSVITHLSDDEFFRAVDMPEEIHQKYDELKLSYGEEGAKTKTVEWLNAQPEIGEAGLSESGDGIWYILESGVLEGILLGPEGTDGDKTNSMSPLFPDYKPKVTPINSQRMKANSISPTIGNRKVMVIAPSNQQFKKYGTDFEENVYDMFINSSCPTFTVDKFYDSAATVDVFKKLSDYGVVVLHTHGNALFKLSLVWQSLDDIFTTPWKKVIFLTGEEVTKSSKSAYETDLKKGRLVIISHSVDDVSHEHYAITPAFISYYCKSFPKSIVYNGSCRSMYNNTMCNAFMEKSVGTYFAFSETVWSDYDRDIALTLFDSLINKGRTTGEAFNDTTTINNADDGGTRGDIKKEKAYFLIRGKNDLIIKTEGVINGTFELGSINGWIGQGDVRIISQLGPLSPAEGTYMLIISTGLGSVDNSDSRISQSFCAPIDVNTLSFDYNFVSEEPMEFLGSEYDDKFEVVLTTANGTVTIATESINTSSWSSINGVDFYGGDETTYTTGWKHVDYDISGLTGSITLEFRTWDKGDSYYDTATLIDNIRLN